jgi:hypothetical protein
MTLNIVPMVAASPIEVAYADAFSAVDGGGQTTWNFGGRNFGTVLPGRRLALFVYAQTVAGAVTIGGVSATSVWTSGTNYSVWMAPEASAGSGTVSITTTTTSFYLYAVLHAVYGLSANTITGVTPVSGNPAATSFDVPWGSAAFAIGHRVANSSATWSGLTEGADGVMTINPANHYNYTSAAGNFPDGAVGQSVSVNMGGTCSMYPFILSH